MSDSVAGTAELAPATELRADALIIGYVGFAHLISHFFQLVLPPLFPWLRLEFGYSYAQLGVMMSVLFVLSGVGQVVAGFLVDHYGAFKTLCAGLVCRASLQVDGKLTSRQHAELSFRQGRFNIRDESTNGTYVVEEDGTRRHLRREEGVLVGNGTLGFGSWPEDDPGGSVRYMTKG